MSIYYLLTEVAQINDTIHWTTEKARPKQTTPQI